MRDGTIEESRNSCLSGNAVPLFVEICEVLKYSEMATCIVPKHGDTKRAIEGDQFNMVLIGETGTGKTSFIRLIKNYANQPGEDFQPSKLTNYDPPKIVGKSMKSDTTKSCRHDIYIPEMKLTIIDTPGLDDTRGTDQTKDNIANIIHEVKQANYVNCVCLVINGTESRLTCSFKEVITEITKILPNKVLNNLIVVLTKSYDIRYISFEVSILKDEFDLTVPQKHIFSFENPYCKWVKIPDRDPSEVKSQFDAAFITLKEIFSAIQPFKPVLTNTFGELHKVINEIKLGVVTILKCQENIQRTLKMKELFQANASTQKAYYMKTKVILTPFSKNVICLQTDCNSTCHDSCNCFWSAFFHSSWMCTIIKKGTCGSCTHSNSKHSRERIKFETEKVEASLLDENGNNIEDPEKKKKCLIKMIEEEITKHEEERERVYKSLIRELVRFQSVGSYFCLHKIANEVINDLKNQVKDIPSFDGKAVIMKMLNDMMEIAKNPYSDNGELKDSLINWACGMFEIDPTDIREEEITKLIRENLKIHHPDSRGNNDSSGFKLLNRARDILKEARKKMTLRKNRVI